MNNTNCNVELTITEKGIWRRAKSGERLWRYMVQEAPTMRARCRKCSQFITKGDLKWGIPIRHSHGEYGWITAWQHLGCTRISERDGIGGVVYGFDLLNLGQQKYVLNEVTSDVIPKHLQPLDPDDLIKRESLPEAEPPSDLLRPLLRYQKEGLGWLVSQEKSPLKGGILADEMGMGKTIQMISLFLAHRLVGPTLIVSPVSSMLHWENEISQHTTPGSLSVVVVSRGSDVKKEEMEKADVVLTTYPMLEHSWRVIVNETKVMCSYCEQLFLPRQLVVHNRYFCGPNAKKTLKQRKREKSGSNNKPVLSNKIQRLETIRKGLRALDVDMDDDEDDAEDDLQEDLAEKTGIGATGPMGMYRELMIEAGRKIRSRWEPARDGSESSEGTTSPSQESIVVVDSDDNIVSSESSDDDKLSCFKCLHCQFQLLRYPFCPKTGQHHVVSDEMKRMIETDNKIIGIDTSRSAFHSITWGRIVLDEAHRIKSSDTSTSRSALSLLGEYRWCLTGTPLQNRVGDVYSLVRFLRMAPFARYYCNTDGCSCSSFSHPFSGTDLRQCMFCGHGPVQHYAYFNRHILNPIMRYGYIGDGRRGMMTLANDVLHKCMLRRTKAERANDLQLPPMSIKTIRVKLTESERNFYESLYKKSTATFDTFVNKGTVLHNYAHIFQLLSRLRQALDHPLLVVESMKVGSVHNDKGVCGICTENCTENMVQVHPCKHTFHQICMSQFIESSPSKEYQCPVCFVAINVDLRQIQVDGTEEEAVPVLPPELQDEMIDALASNTLVSDGACDGLSKSSSSTKKNPPKESRKQDVLSRLDLSKPLCGTKMDAVATYVSNVPEGEKVIIFSQFGGALDLIQFWLQRVGVKSVKLVGSLMLSQRQAVLGAFLHDPGVRAILISLKAGGEGLNLQVANHVILVDPWWNPAVEMQAAQRAHRIGQTKPVHVIRFITESSVEERMLNLQEKKMLVFEGTIDGKLTSLQNLTEDDLQFLFTR
ncbi:Poly(ADP ribose) polymerase and DNA Ligase Zn finger region SNF2 family N terminal domain [Trypanosoma vivax]|nr:DNA repair protein [Trypanosoma vivax]KAH8619108.1 Poly(ADP ribose) polymerase and DNA Ligase Zn finger region SNF2 family N terminal domain [Trypanosoma vivax]